MKFNSQVDCGTPARRNQHADGPYASDDIHPVHLHRHSFELTRMAGKTTAGIMKDVVMVGGYQEVEADFVAENPGRTLFHCHQQLHMDFGFMALFDYAWAPRGCATRLPFC